MCGVLCYADQNSGHTGKMAPNTLPPYLGIDPDAALSALDGPVETSGFADIAAACDEGRADLAGRGLQQDGRRQLRLFSTWEITRYLIPVAQGTFPPGAEAEPRPAPGAVGNRRRRQMVQSGRGAAPARAFRGRRLEGQELPALPPRGSARQDRCRGQFQGRRGQDQHGGASGHVGGSGRLQGAGDRSGQPGLDDVDLRRSGGR